MCDAEVWEASPPTRAVSSTRTRSAADRSRRLGMLRSAPDVAPSPPSIAPYLIIIMVAVVASIAMMILLGVMRKSRP
jgi:hypothetical protein